MIINSQILANTTLHLVQGNRPRDCCLSVLECLQRQQTAEAVRQTVVIHTDGLQGGLWRKCLGSNIYFRFSSLQSSACHSLLMKSSHRSQTQILFVSWWTWPRHIQRVQTILQDTNCCFRCKLLRGEEGRGGAGLVFLCEPFLTGVVLAWAPSPAVEMQDSLLFF